MRDDELEALAAKSDELAAGQFSRRLRAIEDFRYDEIQGKYWDITTGTLLEAKSVDGAIPKDCWPTTSPDAKGKVKLIKPSIAINDVMTGLTVETSTWWPGKPLFLENVFVNERGAMNKKGAVTYNTYVAPAHDLKGIRGKPTPWLNHIKKLWPDPVEHEHFFNFAAHMIQRPDEKVNHGVLLAGSHGIGKDTAMHPLRKGVGEWNAQEIGPDAINTQYNGYVKAVLLVINEVRPHDEHHRASEFYEKLKPILAAPPDMTAMRILYHNVIHIRNLCHVMFTANDPLKMFLPPEDRRVFVMTSPLPDPKTSAVFEEGYFDNIWKWMLDGGAEKTIRWLMSRDISAFNPNEAPPMTSGKQAIIESAHAVRRTAIDDLFERYVSDAFEGKMPDVIFPNDLLGFIAANNYFDDSEKIVGLIRAKNFHFKMDERGYVMLRNPYASEFFKGKFRSRTAYVAKSVPREKQIELINQALEKRPLTFDQAQ